MQLALPCVDMRPICPTCKKPANFLAQWAPGDKVYICKRCYERVPPPDVFVLHDNSAGVGLNQSMDRDVDQMRMHYHDLINSMVRMNRGCVYTLRDHEEGRGIPCERLGHESYWNCKLCRNEAKTARRYSFKNSPPAWINQVSLPICARCGEVHTRKYSHVGDYQTYCQHCDDMNSVEAMYRNRGIFGGDDDEAILDRLQNAFPDLFERGVLPDYWFQLAREMVEK